MFSDGEKKRRVEAVRGLMQDEKLDVLLTIGNGCVGTCLLYTSPSPRDCS